MREHSPLSLTRAQEPQEKVRAGPSKKGKSPVVNAPPRSQHVTVEGGWTVVGRKGKAPEEGEGVKRREADSLKTAPKASRNRKQSASSLSQPSTEPNPPPTLLKKGQEEKENAAYSGSDSHLRSR